MRAGVAQEIREVRAGGAQETEKIFRQSIETEAGVIENAFGGVGVDEFVEKLEESVAEILVENPEAEIYYRIDRQNAGG